MTSCTVGVMAYNEEANIARLLHALLDQRLAACRVIEIIVVASGCTDRTVELAAAVAAAHPLVRVDVQARRRGKAAAINRLIEQARGEVIVLVGGDTLPDPTAIEELTAPFADPAVGMTGARVVPLNDPRTVLGFAVQTLWQMHHRMALRWPKLGELVAFRNVVPAIPVGSATDEVALEALISAAGYRLAYAPEAVVYNRGPQTLGDFLAQRRRIFAGHLQIATSQGYVAASLPLGHLVPIALEATEWHPYLLLMLLISGGLELLGRALGALDHWAGRRHQIWRRVGSTKELEARARTLTLVAMQCPAGSVSPARLLYYDRRAPAARGLLWCDRWHSQLLFAVEAPPSPGALQEQLQALAAYVGRQVSGEAAGLDLRVVQFAAPDPAAPPLREREVGGLRQEAA